LTRIRSYKFKGKPNRCGDLLGEVRIRLDVLGELVDKVAKVFNVYDKGGVIPTATNTVGDLLLLLDNVI